MYIITSHAWPDSWAREEGGESIWFDRFHGPMISSFSCLSEVSLHGTVNDSDITTMHDSSKWICSGFCLKHSSKLDVKDGQMSDSQSASSQLL